MQQADRRPSAGRQPNALQALVEQYSSALWPYCYGRLRDRHLAEDAVQETFLRAHRAWRNAPPDDPAGWLFGTARRCCQEIARRRRRPADRADVLQAEPAAVEPDRTDRLEEELVGLPDTERSLVYLKHFAGLTCREIAERLGKPVGTVTWLLSRAYRKLRDRLKQESD